MKLKFILLPTLCASISCLISCNNKTSLNLKSICADLIESQEYCAGDVIKKSDIKVIAQYDNDITRQISCDSWVCADFLESNEYYFSKEGEHIFNITFNNCSTELTINASPTKYTVTFETNGGSSVSSQRVYRNEKVTKPENPTKEGHNFVNWYADKELKTEYDFNNEVNSNLTIYASWDVKKDLVVKFYNIEKVENDKIYYKEIEDYRKDGCKYGEIIEKPADPTLPSGTEYLHFAGWYTSEDLKEQFIFSNPLKTSMNLYAAYTSGNQKIIRINYNFLTDIEYKIVEVNTIVNNIEPRQIVGRNFCGWYSGPEYQTEVKFPLRIEDDLDLYPKYERKSVAVNLDVNDSSLGTVIGGGTYQYGDNVTLTATPTSGNMFLGWFGGSSHDELISTDTSYSFEVGEDRVYLTGYFVQETWLTDNGVTPLLSEDGKYITYGLYPKDRIVNPDKELVDEANKHKAHQNFLYKNSLYVHCSGNPYEDFIKFSDGTQVKIGVDYIFKCDRVKWKVVNKDDQGNYLVDCCEVLYAKAFNGGPDRYYSQSELRKFLNNNFYNETLFKYNNKHLIKTTKRHGDDTAKSEDYVFIADSSEINNWYKTPAEKIKKCSDYAACNYNRCSGGQPSYYWLGDRRGEGIVEMWNQTINPSGGNTCVHRVDDQKCYGISPTIKIKINL